MNQEEKFQSEYEEIDLMDYVKVLLKKKGFIFGLCLITALAAGIFSLFQPKVYKIDTALEIGSIDDQPIEKLEQVKGRIDSNVYYGFQAQEKLMTPGEEPLKIKTQNPLNTSLIITKIESSQPELAKNILEEINNLILKEHQDKIEKERKIIENNIKLIEEKIKLIQDNIERNKNKIKPLESDIEIVKNKIEYTEGGKKNLEEKIDALAKIFSYQDPTAQITLFEMREKLATKQQEVENLYLKINLLKSEQEDLSIKINSLEGNIKDLNYQIQNLKISLEDIQPTKIIKPPIISKNLISSRLLSNVIIALVLGLFLGIILAFFKEWWDRAKI